VTSRGRDSFTAAMPTAGDSDQHLRGAELAPAVIAIMLTLLVWYGLEVVAWVPLSLVANFRKKRNRPSKRVNWPEPSLKL
jgi:hypothetical protein